MSYEIVSHLITNQLKKPQRNASEDYGRSGGYFGDVDEIRTGFKRICVYVQNGLGDNVDALKAISQSMFKIQTNNKRMYELFIFGFGDSQNLHFDKSTMKLGYVNNSDLYPHIASVISSISGVSLCNPATIPEWFPSKDSGLNYHGSRRFDNEDLLIIIGRENEVFIDESLEPTLTYRLKKQILFVEIHDDKLKYSVRGTNFQFKPITDQIETTNKERVMSSFTRHVAPQLLDSLKKEPLYINKLKHDIETGQVFPAIRNSVIDFYYKGGKLFQYDKSGFSTHIKYAAVIEHDSKNYLTEKDLVTHTFATEFSRSYERIKENCKQYASQEALGVSEIYHKHSYAINRDTDIVVLDIEVSLTSMDPDLKVDRIDFLLYNIKEQKLKFIEAKHYSNTDVFHKGGLKVLGQVEKYTKQVEHKRTDIIIQYNKYIDTVNGLFSINLPPVKSVEVKVTLLVFGFDRDQQKGRLKSLKNDNQDFKDVTYCIGNVDKINLSTLWNN